MTSVAAHAKLTLTLRITGVRDDGFHLIDAEMVSLALADRLEIVDASTSELTVSGPFADGVPTDGDNLCLRALELAGRSASIRLHKSIPPGGGLGGGSADQAEGDVGGRARVTGIGEIVEPLERRPLDVTLVIPPVVSSTPAVYAAWDALQDRPTDAVNDLEEAAISVNPVLGVWRDRVAELAGATPTIAGSGATWFLEGRHGDALAGLTDEGARVVETSAL